MERSLATACCLVLMALGASAQVGKINTRVNLKDLEVPSSPSFVITETAPSLMQTPTIPKEFVLGVAQAFQDGNGFPQNYSMEFAPYWWLKTKDRNVYTLVGLQRNAAGEVVKEDPFAGLKFTSFSVAFLTKDLIPDTSAMQQKMVSLGVRTTLVKLHLKSYAGRLKEKIAAWHAAAQKELEIFQADIARAEGQKKLELIKQLANFKPSTTSNLVQEINDIILQKPVFLWNVAAAHATYGVGDSSWQTGRYGIWTNLSSFLPLALGNPDAIKNNYISLNLSFRFITDHFFKTGKNVIEKANLFDVGGKIELELDRVVFGYEYFSRSHSSLPQTQKRSVGIVSYKISDNFFVNGAFGENFGQPGKLVSLLGLRLGLGKEAVSLPQ